MDPRDFQKLAAKLSMGSSKAEFRTAIGRSYYSAFNLAADYLRSLGFSIRRNSSAHGEVLHCLSNSSNPDLSEVVALLNRIHKQRNRADYELEQLDVETRSAATKVVEWAKQAIEAMEAIFTGPNRAQIQSAISTWRRANGYP